MPIAQRVRSFLQLFLFALLAVVTTAQKKEAVEIRYISPERYERATMQMRREGQRDPTSSKWIAGLPPAQLGGGLLAALDEAAQTTLLRPIPGRPGQVNVGAPEKVADPPPAR